MDEERVIQDEQEIAVIQVEGGETQAKIDQLTNTMAQLLSALPLPTEPMKQDVSPITADPPITRRAKPSLSSQVQWRLHQRSGFLQLMQDLLYIQLCPDYFWDDQAKNFMGYVLYEGWSSIQMDHQSIQVGGAARNSGAT